MTQEQTLRNHSRIVPAFHYGVFLPLLANLIWSIASSGRDSAGRL